MKQGKERGRIRRANQMEFQTTEVVISCPNDGQKSYPRVFLNLG
jgi:hypothetical protein